VLLADLHATSIAGGTSGSLYYSTLWSDTRNFTIELYKKASYSLAALIYTAWTEAGSPVIFPDAIEDKHYDKVRFSPCFPNPAAEFVSIPFEVTTDKSPINIEVFDHRGVLIKTLLSEEMKKGTYSANWNVQEFSNGIYYIVMTTRDSKTAQKIAVTR
jgi:hypothetical protein